MSGDIAECCCYDGIDRMAGFQLDGGDMSHELMGI